MEDLTLVIDSEKKVIQYSGNLVQQLETQEIDFYDFNDDKKRGEEVNTVVNLIHTLAPPVSTSFKIMGYGRSHFIKEYPIPFNSR